MIFYIEQQGGSVTKALQGKISSASGKFAQKLVITIPPDLQQPAPGLYARADRPQEHAFRTRRARTPSSRASGARSKKHTFGAKLTFAPNPAAPPKPSASGTSTAKCSLVR